MTDLSATLAPKSDQLTADDLIADARTIKITSIDVNLAAGTDRPVSIFFEGDGGRPYKPSLNMRRVLAKVWGLESDAYIGRSITLHRDDKVQYGGQEVGGIRIFAMSNIDKQATIPLRVTSKVVKPFTVRPLETPTIALPDTADLRAAFDGLGVTALDLEKKVGRVVSQFTAEDVAMLRGVYSGVKRGTLALVAEFPLPPTHDAAEPVVAAAEEQMDPDTARAEQIIADIKLAKTARDIDKSVGGMVNKVLIERFGRDKPVLAKAINDAASWARQELGAEV